MRESFAVIFDNDGVLVDSEHFSILAYRQAIEEQGVELRDEDSERNCGLTDADIARDMVSRYGGTVDVDRFNERKRVLYLELAREGKMQPFAGAAELVAQLKQEGIPYALASSGSREKIDFNLELTGLDRLFDVVVSGEDFSRGKPDPEIFLRSAEKLGVEPGRCVVIEDSINGLKAARAAGMTSIGVATTFKPDRLKTFADHVVNSLTELTVNRLRDLSNGQ